MASKLNTRTEETKIFSYDSGKVIDEELEFLSNAEDSIDICIDCEQPQSIVGIKQIMKSLLDAKARAAKTRCITEITNENLSYCKELINLTDELRHLEGVRPNFMISEKEILLAPLSLRKEKMRHRESQTRHIVYSNLKEIVQQQQYLFDSLWDKGVSAEERIKKIEEGRDSHHYEITIIRNPQEIIKDISRQIEDSNELLICTTAGGLQFTHVNLFGVMKKVLARQNKCEHNGIRFISDLNRDNVNVAKMFTDAGVQLRHAKILPSMSFHVTDKYIATTIEKLASGTDVQSLLISDDPTYLSHFKNIFEELWENGIDATDIIRDIEEGKETDVELINAKHYVNEILEEISSMKHRAKQQGYDMP